MSLLNYTAGSFVSCLRVESWRCGQKISEVFRDLQSTYIAGADCPILSNNLPNGPPDVTPPGPLFCKFRLIALLLRYMPDKRLISR